MSEWVAALNKVTNLRALAIRPFLHVFRVILFNHATTKAYEYARIGSRHDHWYPSTNTTVIVTGIVTVVVAYHNIYIYNRRLAYA